LCCPHTGAGQLSADEEYRRVSVAFRRESDEEHKEPRFELPIPAGPNYVTRRGRRLLDDRLAEVEARHAAAADDTEREVAARELRYWRTRQVTAIDAPVPPADEVAFGSRIRVLMSGAERVLEIVGDDEAEPAAGRIAWSAPLALALRGAGEGERVAFGGGVEVVEILKG
jgi:transcription elongation GreA/GreB family factor